ncbi:dihydroxyacetone kinase phosphoryl donor subunit DhaM [Streptomyces decoyicus]|uniref:phosphoenolpyruvate--glycerone phosphotransferase n=1 Tax=Streptomyces decoyicus TaxID=249567 RepID=A0ABZ1FUG6_9ACTN|nr:dihydroxyacetone kinase phosphoryl donor subunit DhaM [Streptomyces decoyicus]WSB73716.1 dihydroxyacetone kinase phosphoryl donor subunit DhaM [Streptomyces decoyicus]
MSTPVGIVLVSHSAELAAGLRLLVGQIGSDAVPVVTAAGTDDGRIGTSYELVLNAIEDADRGAGVVVLPDLGSSVLTTRTVLDDHPRPDVVIADAPFVEGAVAAVVAAASGAGLHTVVKSAEEARHVRKL